MDTEFSQLSIPKHSLEGTSARNHIFNCIKPFTYIVFGEAEFFILE